MASPNPWQDPDPDSFARSIADQARQDSEAAMGGQSSSSKGRRDRARRPPRDRPSPPINPLDSLPPEVMTRSETGDPDDALARVIADRARRQSEAYIGQGNGAGDRLWLYLILTPGVGMALSPWILVRSRSTIRQRQASRFALGVGIVWLAMTMLSAGNVDAGPLASLNSAATWIYVFLMLSQMVRVWQRKSLPIKH